MIRGRPLCRVYLFSGSCSNGAGAEDYLTCVIALAPIHSSEGASKHALLQVRSTTMRKAHHPLWVIIPDEARSYATCRWGMRIVLHHTFNHLKKRPFHELQNRPFLDT